MGGAGDLEQMYLLDAAATEGLEGRLQAAEQSVPGLVQHDPQLFEDLVRQACLGRQRCQGSRLIA